MQRFMMILLSSVLISCDTRYTLDIKAVDNKYLRINKILQTPTRYSGKQVLVKGVTSEITKTPFFTLYRLTDASGSIWVQTDGGIPAENSEIYLNAKVETMFLFREHSAGLHLSEINRELQ